MLGSFLVAASSPPTSAQGKVRINENEEEVDNPKPQATHICYDLTTNPYTLCTVIYGLWIMSGVIFYKFYGNWTTSTAFYYAIEAGLSIGFCNPAEKDDWSKLFTIVYVLIGSSVVSGCLGFFASVVIYSKVEVARRDANMDNMTIRDSDDKITFRSFFYYAWYRVKLFAGWYSNRSRFIIVCVFVFWMSLGVAYGMTVEKWTFITSLYWAITSCSTGGLQSAECQSHVDDGYTHCDMGNMRGSLMGVFMMIGVPIYACTLAEFAKIAIAHAIEAREAKLLSRPINDAEFIFAANILSAEGSETLVCGEYILLELMRLGQTNQHQIEKIKRNFRLLDKQNLGELDINDLRRTGKVVTKQLRPGQIVKKLRSRSYELLNIVRTPSKPDLTDVSNTSNSGDVNTRSSNNGATTPIRLSGNWSERISEIGRIRGSKKSFVKSKSFSAGPHSVQQPVDQPVDQPAAAVSSNSGLQVFTDFDFDRDFEFDGVTTPHRQQTEAHHISDYDNNAASDDGEDGDAGFL